MEAPASSLSATEQSVAELWNEVLPGAAPSKGSDNFFQMGGDSVSMVTVIFRIKEEFGIELPPEAIFQAPTLTELAEMIVSTTSCSPPA